VNPTALDSHDHYVLVVLVALRDLGRHAFNCPLHESRIQKWFRFSHLEEEKRSPWTLAR
jgi:hypothetical protein